MSVLGLSFFNNNKLVKVQNATAAGTTDIESDSVDRSGYESVAFFTTPGTITGSAVTSMHIETSSDDSTFNDVLGTNIAIADDDDNQIFGVEIVKPLERYLRCVIDRATQNAVVGEIYAVLSNPSKGAVDNNVDDTITTEIHISPAEGTI